MPKQQINSAHFSACSMGDASSTEFELIVEACEYLKSRGITTPDTGIILGSGLGNYISAMTNPIRVPYADIPGFMRSTAPSHEGALYYGEHCGRNVLIMSGRFHYYEGWPMRAVAFPIRVMAVLGVKRLIVTNAAGSINLDFKPGSLMLISDHINMSGVNPLIGPNIEELGVRFPDMTDTYSSKLRGSIKEAAATQGITLYEGVYAMMSGPSFETPAEIRFLRTVGADAVGMSTVPEVITARHAGLEIVGISCLANAAAGILDKPLTSEEVNEATSSISDTIIKVVDMAVMA